MYKVKQSIEDTYSSEACLEDPLRLKIDRVDVCSGKRMCREAVRIEIEDPVKTSLVAGRAFLDTLAPVHSSALLL